MHRLFDGQFGGYVLLALLLHPICAYWPIYRAGSSGENGREWWRCCVIFISFTYGGAMRGGVVFSRFLECRDQYRVVMAVVFSRRSGRNEGITYTQVAQYCVLIFCYMVPPPFLFRS